MTLTDEGKYDTQIIQEIVYSIRRERCLLIICSEKKKTQTQSLQLGTNTASDLQLTQNPEAN